jgi:hypothetical protein
LRQPICITRSIASASMPRAASVRTAATECMMMLMREAACSGLC